MVKPDDNARDVKYLEDMNVWHATQPTFREVAFTAKLIWISVIVPILLNEFGVAYGIAQSFVAGLVYYYLFKIITTAPLRKGDPDLLRVYNGLAIVVLFFCYCALAFFIRSRMK